MSKYISKISKTNDNDAWQVTINIPKESEVYDSNNVIKILDKIKLNIVKDLTPTGSTSKLYSAPYAIGNISANYIQIGNVGTLSDKSNDKLYYPAGNWDKNTEYIMGEHSTPYVHHENNYYALKISSSIGDTPSNTSTAWRLINSFKSIQTEYLFAPNAVIGSELGSVFYNNFLYSQQGLADNGNIVHYSTYVNSNDSNNIFEDSTDNPEKLNISKLTGTFKPNLSMDFYNGEISCNRLCEQYDYFHVIDINMDYANGVLPKYINTYKMQTNKSHNICVTSRNIPYYDDANGTNSIESTMFDITRYTRPGVIVLPGYESDYTSDGIRLCINYPLAPGSGYDISRSTLKPDNTGPATFNQFRQNEGYQLTNYYVCKDKYFSEDENITTCVYKYGNLLKIDGYILVCADPDIFNPNMYETDDNGNKIFMGDKEANCFIWNGLKSKFLLLCEGSELLVRGILVKHRCSSSTINNNNGNVLETDYGKGYSEIMDLSLNYIYDNGTSAEEISLPKIHILEKNVGLQWVIENTNSFNPIPMNIQIDNFNPSAYNSAKPAESFNSLCKFECNLPDYMNSSEFTCLGSGTIDYDYGKISYDSSTIKITKPNPAYDPNSGTTGVPEEITETITVIDPYDMTGISRNPKRSIFHSSLAKHNFKNNTWENVPTIHLNINENANFGTDDFTENKKIYTSTCIDGWPDEYDEINDEYRDIIYMPRYIAYC